MIKLHVTKLAIDEADLIKCQSWISPVAKKHALLSQKEGQIVRLRHDKRATGKSTVLGSSHIPD